MGWASGAAPGPRGGTLVTSQLKRNVNPSHFCSQFHSSQTSMKADVGVDLCIKCQLVMGQWESRIRQMARLSCEAVPTKPHPDHWGASAFVTSGLFQCPHFTWPLDAATQQKPMQGWCCLKGLLAESCLQMAHPADGQWVFSVPGCQWHRDVHCNWGSVGYKVEVGDLFESFVFSTGHTRSKLDQWILVAKSHYG